MTGHESGGAPSWRRQEPVWSVITSYSIHYTKLYELLVWGVIASLYVSSLALLVMNLPMVKVFTKVLQMPDWALVPNIIVLSFLGVYSVNGSTFSLMVMIVLGVFAYVLRKLHYPMAPVILGFVLGELIVITSYSIHYTKLYE